MGNSLFGHALDKGGRQIYLNFQSHHLAVHKRAVVKTPLHRAEALSSSGVSRVEEKHVTKALQKNGYPISFVHRRTIPAKSSQVPDNSGRHASLTLPYLGGLSKSLHRVLSLMAIRVIFHPFATGAGSPQGPGSNQPQEGCSL